MAELDMVINGLTCCINHNDCKKCPYANEYDTTFDCIDRTRKDALELLNRHSPVKPIKHRDEYGITYYDCGNCQKIVQSHNRANYCQWCGHEIDWYN